MSLETTILIIYIVSLSILFIFGSHGFIMIYHYFKTYNKRTEDLKEEDFILKEYPIVTIQIPLFNEKYVTKRLIDAVCRMDYEKDKLEIQVLDDSTDDSIELTKRL